MMMKINIQRKILLTAFIMALLFYTNISNAMSCAEPPCAFWGIRMWNGEVQISDREGIPCFNVDSDEKEVLEFGGIAVDEVSPDKYASPLESMWALKKESSESEEPTFLFSPSVCLPYGKKIENLKQAFEAKKLQPGKIYAVVLFTSGNKKEHFKEGYFCLVRKDNGEMKVHQLLYADVKKSDWNLDVCKSLNPTQLDKPENETNQKI